MRLAVDDDPALAADPLAAVVVEGDRLLTPLDQALVHDIEHLEERHVRADVAGLIADKPPLGAAFLLAPDTQGQVERSCCTAAAHELASRVDRAYRIAVACRQIRAKLTPLGVRFAPNGSGWPHATLNRWPANERGEPAPVLQAEEIADPLRMQNVRLR